MTNVVRDDVLDQQPPRPRADPPSDAPDPVAFGVHHDTGSSEASSTCSLTSWTVEQSAMW
jgi:hypothetical protein